MKLTPRGELVVVVLATAALTAASLFGSPLLAAWLVGSPR